MMAARLLRCFEEVDDMNVESSGEFQYSRQRRAALAPENLRQVAFREIGLEIEAVQRTVLLDHYLAQSPTE
jgi:hypothetical protein